VQRQTGGTGDLTLVVPYVTPAPGLFTLVVVDFNAEDNIGLFMAENRCAYTPERRSRRNLAGETGLRVWFVSVIDGINKARIADQTTGFSYDLEFTTTLEGHIRPSFETTYPSGRIFSGAFDINRNREDKHTLNVAFAPPAPTFAKTPLGQALARIEAELRAARTKEAKAKEVRDEKKLAFDKAPENFEVAKARGSTADTREQFVEKARSRAVAAEEALQRASDTVSNLQSERAALGAAAVAAWASAGASVSTRQQLNNLKTLDAIRSIPR